MSILIRDAEPKDANQMGVVMVSAFFSAFLGPVAEEYLDLSWSPETSAAAWRRYFESERSPGEFLLVATSDNSSINLVVGLAMGRRNLDHEGYKHRLASLQVLPSHHRQGIGRKLVAAAAIRFQREGDSGLIIGCAKENPNCAFYRALGGVEIGREPSTIDRFPTEEILFGWDSLEALMPGSE